MILKLVSTNHKSLRLKSKPVTNFDTKLKKFVEDMEETLLSQADPEGVGLAAPQVGKNIQVFLMRFTPEEAQTHSEKSEVKTIINPKIVKVSKPTKTKRSEKDVLEGCLSIPNFYGPISRPNRITIDYQDVRGIKHTQTFKGFPASIVIHEIDHLEGVLFVDRLLEQKGKLYEFKNDKWYEVDLL